jgi:uncharacterized repeat protein (TIGR03803 family)
MAPRLRAARRTTVRCLIRDKEGNFYGTTKAGGEPRLGVVFKISNQ